MADKILKTRIQNKYDSAANWSTSQLTLLKGELAIMPISISTDADDIDPADGDSYTAGYMIKVGDGTNKTFKDSKGIVAYAADVHSWAKAATFNEGDYSKDGTASPEYGNLRKTHEAIHALQQAIGTDGSVGDMITAAITNLTHTDVDKQTGYIVKAVTQANGKVTVTYGQIAHDEVVEAMKTVTREELVLIDAELDRIEASVTTVANTIGGSYTTTSTVAMDIASIKTTLGIITGSSETEGSIEYRIAQALISVNSSISGLREDVDENTSTLAGFSSSATVKATTDSLGNRLTTAEGDIDVLEKALAGYTSENAVALKFSAVETTLGQHNTSINDHKSRLETLEGQITGVTGAMHFVGALEAAPSSANNGDVYVNTKNNKEFVYSDGAWVELGDVTDELRRISALEGSVGSADDASTKATLYGKLAKEIADRAAGDSALSTSINVLSNSVSGEISSLKTADATLQSNIDTVNGIIGSGYTSTNTVKKAIEAVDGRVTTANGNIATNAQNIQKNETAIGVLDERLTTAETNIGTNASDIDALETKVGNIETAIGSKTDAKENETVYGALAKHAYEAEQTYATKTKLSEVSTAVNTITSAGYLKSTDTSGKLVDSLGNTIVFDCGGAE